MSRSGDDERRNDASPPADAPGRRRWRVTRRGFLIGTAAAGAGVLLGWRLGVPAARLAVARALDGAAAPGGGVDGPPDAWFELPDGGPLRLYLPKVEMGQGVHTALAQLAAEELELDPSEIEVRSAPSTRGLDDRMGTSASSSVASSWTPVREAAAMLREALRSRAAEHWDVPLADVFAMDGRIVRRDAPDTRLAYGALAALGPSLPFPDEPPALKPRGEFRVVGRSPGRVDIEAKLAGEGGYGLDARLPGMRYGAAARPPRIGARLVSAAPGGAREVPGVLEVVIEDGFAGVVADRRSAARRGVAALETRWEGPDTPVTQDEVDRATTVGAGGVRVQREGRPGRLLRERVDVEADYRTPMAAHAHLEPQAAVVDVRSDGVTALVATQSPTAVRDELAELLGRPQEEVDLTATWLGGAFGRRLNVAVARDAARLSRAVGAPVHVAFDREEEFRHGYVRPPVHNLLEARVDDGRIVAWRHRQASGDVALPFLPNIAGAVLGADFGAWRGATSPYGGIAHRETFAQRVRLRVPTGWWRGLGLMPNVFATESFMDEVARSLGADPLAFRLDHLGDDALGRRMAAALNAAAEAADWRAERPAGRGRGVAVAVDVGTVVAQVAEVAFEDGELRVDRIVAAVDPGLIVNPDGVRAQTEGSVAMGMSSVLHEELTIEDGRFAPSNFDRYPLLRAGEMPDVEVILLEGDDEPHGVGEPPLGPVAAAVANALVDAGGPRLRRLPLRPA